MYCTRDDLIERFGATVVADLEYGRPGAVTEAIDDANGLIDSYLGARYPLPMAIVPVVLKRVARDLVRYGLDIDPDETVQRRRDEAVKFLTGLSKGEVSLGMPAADEPDSFDNAEIQSDGHVFRRSDSTGFI